MGWTAINKSLNSVDRSKRQASPGQRLMIAGLYNELGMDYDEQDIESMTDLEAHKAINELLAMKREI